MSKDYNENDNKAGGEASLSEKVKGKTDDSGASFGAFKNPDGGSDGNAADPNGTGVRLPNENAPGLPKAGKTV